MTWKCRDPRQLNYKKSRDLETQAFPKATDYRQPYSAHTLWTDVLEQCLKVSKVYKSVWDNIVHSVSRQCRIHGKVMAVEVSPSVNIILMTTVTVVNCINMIPLKFRLFYVLWKNLSAKHLTRDIFTVNDFYSEWSHEIAWQQNFFEITYLWWNKYLKYLRHIMDISDKVNAFRKKVKKRVKSKYIKYLQLRIRFSCLFIF